MNPEAENNPALPLEELMLTPEWVKAPVKSFSQHTGEDRGPRKPGVRSDRPPYGGRPPRAPMMKERRPQRRDFQPRGAPQPVANADRKPQPPPELPVEVAFFAEDNGFSAMVDAMKQASRAYALFDIAKLVLNRPERHMVKVTRKPGPDGAREPLVLVLEDGQVCLTQDEAVRHIFRNLADKVSKEVRREVDPPRGNFAFVNRCGITGEWLGPPNYHEYPNRLVRHHQQRLSHMPFEQFKARIQTVRDPEAVKNWIDSVSVVFEYQCVLDTEPAVFSSRRDLERHFIENHLAQFISTAAEVQISGVASRQLLPGKIHDAIRRTWELERRFPLNTANFLRPRLRHAGFHAFKHKGVNYISSVRPQRFESTQGLTEHVQKIITFLRAHEGSDVKKLFAALLPASEQADPASTAEAEKTLLADLHWLIRDGYVVEFSNGRLWAPADRPPAPPPPAPAASPAQPTAQGEAPVQPEPEVASETPPSAEPANEPANGPAPEAPAEPTAVEASESGVVPTSN